MNVSSCPKCNQPVSVPDGVDPGGRVQCPLCSQVFPLADALGPAPPMLIPVNGEAATSESADDSNIETLKRHSHAKVVASRVNRVSLTGAEWSSLP